MKNLLSTLALGLFCLTASSQADCNCSFYTTLGIHYNHYKGTNGVGLEYGKTGDESNFNIHVGVDLYFPRVPSNSKQKMTGDSAMTGRMYNKVGYRIIRVPYLVSVYTDLIGGLDMNIGLFYGVGIRFLHPFKENAISFEPMYIPGKKGGWNLQAAFHFKL